MAKKKNAAAVEEERTRDRIMPETISNDPSVVISTYGPAQRDESSASDDPRPLIPVRILEYHPERIRLAFAPDVLVGSAPPFEKWVLAGCIDLGSNTEISAAEAAQRLSGRRGKKAAMPTSE